MGPKESNECKSNLTTISTLCSTLGIPLKWTKVEGPATSLVFLGIVLDTNTMEIRLPPDKLQQILLLLHQWRQRKHCSKRELLSLIGKLVHACKVVRVGRIFLRRMIDTAHSVRHLHYQIRLNVEFRSDLEWWVLFLERWNGRSMREVHNPQWDPDIVFSSDASGSWGCGAVWNHNWLQCPWNGVWSDKSIAAKELVPVVLACAIWGRQWQHKKVLVLCVNMAVVHIVNDFKCKDKILSHLLRPLYFFLAHNDIHYDLRAKHLEGKKNTAADAVSRNFMQVFYQALPKANCQPACIPAALWNLLVVQAPDWMSPSWRALLQNFWATA